MKEYEVSVPVLGVAHLTVNADSPEEALREAVDIAGPDDVDEWVAHDALVEGNFFHGRLNRAQIDNVYDPEADDVDH